MLLRSFSLSSYSGTGPGDPGSIRDVSHITFCYDYEVDVSKTADTSFTRSYSWAIDKWADETGLLLSDGQLFPVNYSVKVDLGSPPYVDGDWAVSGVITIDNNTPFAASIESVSDVISGFGAPDTLECDVSFPYDLASGGALQCSGAQSQRWPTRPPSASPARVSYHS